MAVIDANGVQGKTLLAYLNEIRDAYLAIDSAWNINAESPDGNVIEAWSELMANLDEAILAAYQSVDPDTAVGVQLGRIGEFSGIQRQPATASTATVTFSGVNGTDIPEGFEVRNSETETIWTTDEAVEVSGGTATVGVTCETLGAEPAGIGDLSVIASPISGLTSVTNDNAASLGRDEESDATFRARRSRSVAAPGSNQVDSMVGRVANVEGVKHVRIYENVTGTTDSNGLFDHSIAVFVDGGEVDAIAQAMAVRKNPGTGLNADNTFDNKVQTTVVTPAGNNFNATFYRPVLTTIYVAVEASGNINASVIAEIKSNIVEYAAGELFGDGVAGFDRVGFGIGQVVTAGKLYTPVNEAIGSDGAATSVLIGTASGNVTLTSVDPGFNGLAVFDESNIEVTVV